ncbi:branched-chain amino acid ABC transporter permease [Haloarchaeobius sp. DFWS5]|uniref:branched-chain amino acid ABC transporter permease n=1 Tax=Haloarchaeobius sp. DFWS5 TaxID=3446114 RepID=UPI003EB7421A
MSDSVPDTDSPTVRHVLDPRNWSIRHRLGIVGLFALALLPFQLSTLDLLKATGALYLAVFVMSWDFVSGYTGQMSFGHTFFFAIGGYTSALLNLGHGVDPLLSIPAGVALAALSGFIIGAPALRLQGPYLALITLTAPLILLRIFVMFSDIFGGDKGLPSPATLVEFDDFVQTVDANYYLAFAVFLFVLGVTYAITRSDHGTVFTAIREDQEAVAASGINPAKFKIFAFVTSAALGGLGGAVFVHTPVGNASPSQLLDLAVMIEILIAAIFGGLGTIVGPAIGGLFLYTLRDWIGQQEWMVPVLDMPVTRLDLLLFYTLTLFFLFFLPSGLVPWSIDRGRQVIGRFGGNRPNVAADGGASPLEQIRDRYREEIHELTDDDRGDDR